MNFLGIVSILPQILISVIDTKNLFIVATKIFERTYFPPPHFNLIRRCGDCKNLCKQQSKAVRTCVLIL